MPRILALRATLDRITSEFVDGVMAAIVDSVRSHAASMPAQFLRAGSDTGSDRRSREENTRPSQTRPPRPRETPARGTRAENADNARGARGSASSDDSGSAGSASAASASEAPPRFETPNAVTDPELLLAALEHRTDGEASPAPAPAPRRRGRPRGPSKKKTALLEQPPAAPAAPEPPRPGPALRSDEVSLRTLGGGVVIRRIRRDTQAV